MSDQVYQIQMRSAMGIKQGTAEISMNRDRITLSVLGGENQFLGEFIPEYAFQMTGTLKTALHDLPATLQGVLSECQFSALLMTEKGDFPISGKRLGPAEADQAGTDQSNIKFQELRKDDPV